MPVDIEAALFELNLRGGGVSQTEGKPSPPPGIVQGLTVHSVVQNLLEVLAGTDDSGIYGLNKESRPDAIKFYLRRTLITLIALITSLL